MRTRLLGTMMVLVVAAAVSGGCAKKNVVKTEEPVAAQPAPPVVTPEPARPAPTAETRPMQPAQPAPETPASEAVKQETREQGGAQALAGELERIYFNFDSSALSDEARATLAKNAEMLAKQPSVKLRIEGNCDERGSDEYNMALGERRAKAARDYLVNLGVAADRISTISYGEEKPVDQGHTEEAWAKNRRDDFVIVK